MLSLSKNDENRKLIILKNKMHEIKTEVYICLVKSSSSSCIFSDIQQTGTEKILTENVFTKQKIKKSKKISKYKKRKKTLKSENKKSKVGPKKSGGNQVSSFKNKKSKKFIKNKNTKKTLKLKNQKSKAAGSNSWEVLAVSSCNSTGLSETVFSLSHKLKNKQVKIKNGNGVLGKSLLIAHWNMGSKFWQRKQVEAEVVTMEFKPDLFIVTEANMLNSLSEQEKNITGYKLYVPKTSQVQVVSRMVIFVRESLQVEVKTDLMDTDVAAIWMKVGARGRRPLLIGGVYREHKYLFQDPETDTGSDMSQLLRWTKFVETWVNAARSNQDIMVIGDVNLDSLTWATPTPAHTRMVDLIKQQIETLGFYQMVQGATRSWPGVAYSLVDPVWLNCPGRQIYVKNLERAFSDHNLVVVSMRTKNLNEDRHDFWVRDRRNWDPEAYSEEIQKIDWSDLLETTNVDLIYSKFQDKILPVIDKMAPWKAHQARSSSNSWMTDEVRAEMQNRDDLRRRAKVSGSQDDWMEYKRVRNKVVKMLRTTKDKHFASMYDKIEEEHDIKSLYNLTRKLTGGSSSLIPQQFHIDGRIVRKPQEMAAIQLDYYLKKLEDINSNLIPSDRNPHRMLDLALEKWEEKDERPIFEFSEISLEETEKLISTLSNSTASGFDGLDALAIKSAKKGLVIPVRHLINASIKSSKFSMKWKIAEISPRLKSKDLDRNITSSYRPVSVLPTISKIVERVAQQQLLRYMEDTGQLNHGCHAYRKALSTMTTLIDILDEVYTGTENNMFTSIMAIDQTAAFECVNWELLIEKLERYNVGPRAIAWIRDYLTRRSQYVKIGKASSCFAPVSQGVPQGSVIGPLLFALYTNDVTEVSKDEGCQEPAHRVTNRLFGRNCERCGTITGYADDLTYAVSSKRRLSNQTSIIRMLDEITTYLNDNKLVINAPKTQLTECMIGQKRGKTTGDPPSIIVTDGQGRRKLIRDKDYTRILGANVAGNLL